MRSFSARLFRIGWYVTPFGIVTTMAGLVWALTIQAPGTADPIAVDLAARIWTGGLWIGIGGFLLALSGSVIPDSPAAACTDPAVSATLPPIPRLDADAPARPGPARPQAQPDAETPYATASRRAASR